jgi:hypothetical protein
VDVILLEVVMLESKLLRVYRLQRAEALWSKPQPWDKNSCVDMIVTFQTFLNVFIGRGDKFPVVNGRTESDKVFVEKGLGYL